MNIKDIAASVLGRVGDIASRPSYMVGNEIEAIGYQLAKAIDPNAPGLRPGKQIMGDTNPLTAWFGGLEGKDKVGGGSAVARLAKKLDPDSTFTKVVANPVTTFALNLGTDPLVVSGSLGKGAKLGETLATLGKGEEAGTLAKVAGKVLTPERLQNISLASQGSAGAPALTLPAAGLVGLARKSSKVDDLINGLYGAKAAVAELTPAEKMAQAIKMVEEASPTGAKVGAGLSPIEQMANATKMVSDIKPVVPELAGSGEALRSGLSSGLGAKGAAVGPMERVANFSNIEKLPENMIRRPLPTAAVGRKEAISRLVGTEVPSYSGRATKDLILSKAVVNQAEKIRAALDNPETRLQTVEMLKRLVSR